MIESLPATLPENKKIEKTVAGAVGFRIPSNPITSKPYYLRKPHILQSSCFANLCLNGNFEQYVGAKFQSRLKLATRLYGLKQLNKLIE